MRIRIAPYTVVAEDRQWVVYKDTTVTSRNGDTRDGEKTIGFYSRLAPALELGVMEDMLRGGVEYVPIEQGGIWDAIDVLRHVGQVIREAVEKVEPGN